MDNYDLLSITIDNEFLKNAIRWPQGLVQAIRLSVRRPLGGRGRELDRHHSSYKIFWIHPCHLYEDQMINNAIKLMHNA
jgi:hypothetical protein